MANEEHLLSILKSGVSAWNKWRSEHREIRAVLSRAKLYGADLSRADLSGADLSSADLSGAKLQLADLSKANLSGADLSKADLSKANLQRADLYRANLSGATLHGASLDRASLSRANLSGASLSSVDLGRADLHGADLSGANLSNSIMGQTSVADVDMSRVKGLETVLHLGRSSIGIDTIYRSKGKIPEVFLRGAGVPENFITFMTSLAGTPFAFEYYSCFISYSSKDEAFAKCLYVDLQSKGVRCWFAPHDMKGGRKLEEQIDVAIRLHERLLLILSPDSMKSEWVKTEIAKARKREIQEKKKVLFPVRLVSFKAIQEWECFDADMGKDSAREIREYFIPDFSGWEDSARYKAALGRLLSDLKANDSVPPRA
jgi:hypothetical protein